MISRLVKSGALAVFLLLSGYGMSYASDPANGEQLYTTHCAYCHGSSGVNVMPDAPDFSMNEGLLQPDEVLLLSILNGKASMPAYQGVLSDQDVLDVIAFLRTLN